MVSAFRIHQLFSEPASNESKSENKNLFLAAAKLSVQKARNWKEIAEALHYSDVGFAIASLINSHGLIQIHFNATSANWTPATYSHTPPGKHFVVFAKPKKDFKLVMEEFARLAMPTRRGFILKRKPKSWHELFASNLTPELFDDSENCIVGGSDVCFRPSKK